VAVIVERELQILLNLHETVEVKYPLLNRSLLEVTPASGGYTVKVTARPWKAAPELADWNDLYEAFISAGILRYENLDEFGEMMEVYGGLKKGVAFAPDTNVLYHRFISSYRPLDGHQIVIAEGVKGEIEDAMNHKYRPRQLAELQVARPDLLREFRNRRTKRSRKAAYIALREFEELKDRVTVTGNPGERGDWAIVRALKTYDQRTPALVVLLTADIAMTDVAEMEGLEYFLFHYPRARLGRHFATAHQLRRLLFNLSAVFGVIELNGIPVFGEFGGKVKLDELKVVHAGQDFHFHLGLNRRLMEIVKA